MLWVMMGLAIATGAGGYALGVCRGQRRVADQVMNDPTVGRTVLERLAKRWGAKLELFDVAGDGGPR